MDYLSVRRTWHPPSFGVSQACMPTRLTPQSKPGRSRGHDKKSQNWRRSSISPSPRCSLSKRSWRIPNTPLEGSSNQHGTQRLATFRPLARRSDAMNSPGRWDRPRPSASTTPRSFTSSWAVPQRTPIHRPRGRATPHPRLRSSPSSHWSGCASWTSRTTWLGLSGRWHSPAWAPRSSRWSGRGSRSCARDGE